MHASLDEEQPQRYGCTATLLAGGKVLVASGDDGMAGIAMNQAEIYKP
jgi:hypothetical protein